jgi:hypothetical protein
MTLSLGRSGVHKSGPTKFCTEALNICRSCVRNLVRVTPVGPRILRWPLNFREICAPLSKNSIQLIYFQNYKKDYSEIIKLVFSYGNRKSIFSFVLQVLTSDLLLLEIKNKLVTSCHKFLWRCDPTRVMASSFLTFLDHT